MNIRDKKTPGTPIFSENRRSLEEKLRNNAFRRGTSAFRFGLIQQGASDHLPLSVKDTEEKLNLVSWNLLAEAHLYNNFMNISGTNFLIDSLKKAYPCGNLYFNSKENKMFFFFAELAEFFYKNIYKQKIIITPQLLEKFISTKEQSSQLIGSSNPSDKKSLIEKSRTEMVRILTQEIFSNSSSYKNEFILSIKHCLELISNIKRKAGALKWNNRFTLIKENPLLVKQLQQADFLCLQECSEPNDIIKLFKKSDPVAMLIHRIDNKIKDYCVLIYNKNKFKLLGMPTLLALDGKKPCILAKFQDLATKRTFIIASIHHPGGKHNHLDLLLREIEKLSQEPIPFYMVGDYNHTQPFFQEHMPNQFSMFYPAQGTLAGSDYGNNNLAVDAVVTNQSHIQINLLENLKNSPPAKKMSTTVEFMTGSPGCKR